MSETVFHLGLDDTDAPDGMCTTWLGAKLIRKFSFLGMKVLQARLVRLNPTIQYKTRGNAAIGLKVKGDPAIAFEITCNYVSRYARMSCENTHPGVVITEKIPPADFYWKAVNDHCSIEEAEDILYKYATFWKGYKLRRGLIGATAAICSNFTDYTWEVLMYRPIEDLFHFRKVDPDSIRISEELTTPHTWDSWDNTLKKPVCIPHSPDPVILGIRGDSPFYIEKAISIVEAEPYDMAQIWVTNQGTDAHLVVGDNTRLAEGRSYLIRGNVIENPITGEGGHVSFTILTGNISLPCMAFEPTKKFRDIVRILRLKDEILAVGSYQKGTLNLEKVCILYLNPAFIKKPPVCPDCSKRMTSAGTGKGYKCRGCGNRLQEPEIKSEDRQLNTGWYEVPPGARRHLSRPLARGILPPDGSYLPKH